MKAEMNVPYKDGKFNLQAGDPCPDELVAKLVKTKLASVPKRKPTLDEYSEGLVGNRNGD